MQGTEEPGLAASARGSSATPLTGQVALVTGASEGLGLEIARSLARKGASLAICARRSDALRAACDQLLACRAEPGQRVLAIQADVSQAEDCEKLLSQTIAAIGHPSILVNNAGIWGPKGKIEDVSMDDWEATFRVNVFASVRLVRAVLPAMRERGWGRVVQLSGGGATKPMPAFSAYAGSKSAIVRFIETVALECAGSGIVANCLAPGAMNTQMLDEALAAGQAAVGEETYAALLEQKRSGGASIENAAECAAFLASHDCSGISGRLISAVWDPWKELATLAQDLGSSRGNDVYTLRRVTAKDRGFLWE